MHLSEKRTCILINDGFSLSSFGVRVVYWLMIQVGCRFKPWRYWVTKTAPLSTLMRNVLTVKIQSLWISAIAKLSVNNPLQLMLLFGLVCIKYKTNTSRVSSSSLLLLHPKMKISPCFTHPQGILGVYDFLLSNESSQSYIKNCPWSSKLYNDSKWVIFFNSPKEGQIKRMHPSACSGGGGNKLNIFLY